MEATKYIAELNMKLEDAKEVRQNKLAYDQLAKEVNKHPSREDSILYVLATLCVMSDEMNHADANTMLF